MKGKLQRIDGNSKLVKICIDALNLIRLITRNSFNELVVTQDGELDLFDHYWEQAGPAKFDKVRII
jgi:hypothetical protein